MCRIIKMKTYTKLYILFTTIFTLCVAKNIVDVTTNDDKTSVIDGVTENEETTRYETAVDTEFNDTKTMWSKFDYSIPSDESDAKTTINDEIESESIDDETKIGSIDDELKIGNVDDEIKTGSIDDDSGKTRQKRFLIMSLIQHRMFEVMKMTPSYQYLPTRPHDAFDFLRDVYPLPIGGVQNSYDFVVVGAGSAGSVIASRLSEGGRFSVLLLEAGGPEDLFTQVPLLAAYFQSTDYSWGFKMEKEEGICTGMKDQRCNWPKGKAIGGSSIINYMIYTRGNRIDWDRIAADGNPGWSYDEVFPYYLKSEGAQNLEGLEDTEYHNKDGLLGIEYARFRTKMSRSFLKAAKQKGHNITDYNKGETFGFSRIQCHTRDGWRHSAAKAFLSPFKTRPNLHILPFSRVTKININPSTLTATSVEYIRNRINHKVKAKKEIILSAGTFGSAQLLMLSGVGPKEHLQELKIPVIKNLPVGQTMYDHFCFQGLQFLVNCTGCGVSETGLLTAENTLNWLKFGRGPMTIVGGVEGIGYIKTKISEESENYPDMEILFLPGGITSDASHAVMKGMNIDEKFFQEVYGDIIEKPLFTLLPMMLHPKSKGYMKLKDNNPLHWPKFYYNYFSDRRDMLTLIEAIKYSIELSKTRAFQKYGAKLYDKPYPNCKHHTFGSDDYWECAIRTIGTTLHHQISTCRMGPASDPDAVVDNELRVHGIKRLRVGDASIIPRPITAHTHAPSVMIGERLADFVKEIWF